MPDNSIPERSVKPTRADLIRLVKELHDQGRFVKDGPIADKQRPALGERGPYFEENEAKDAAFNLEEDAKEQGAESD